MRVFTCLYSTDTGKIYYTSNTYLRNSTTAMTYGPPFDLIYVYLLILSAERVLLVTYSCPNPAYLILNFGVSLLLLMWSFTYIYSLFSLSFKNFSYLFLTDLVTRIFSDDFYLNLYYFTWTNLWYLGAFIPVIFGLKLIYRNYTPSILIIFYSLTLNSSFICIYEYFYLNLSLPDASLLYPMFNTLLLNSLNKYHPFLLYFSLTIFLLILISPPAINLYALSFPKWNFFRKSFLTLLRSLVYVNLVALVLGSWWAFQEGSWGGWWNWDISEIFGLYILILILMFVHLPTMALNATRNLGQLTLAGLTLFIFYFFMQLNFNLLSHNFGLRSTYFFIDFNYLVLLSLASLKTIHLFLGYRSFSLGALSLLELPYQLYVRGPLVFSWLAWLSCLIAFTLVVLLNNFSFLFFGINLGNWLPNFRALVYYGFLVVYAYFWYLSSKFFCLIKITLIASYSVSCLIAIRLITMRVSNTLLLVFAHFCLLLVFFLSYVLYSKNLTYWSSTSWGFSGSSTSLTGVLPSYFYVSLAQLNFPLVGNQVNFLPEYLYDYSYSSGGFNNKGFSLTILSYFSTQQFIAGDYLPEFSSTLYDPFLFLLGYVLFIWIYLIYLFSARILNLEH